MSHGYWVTRVDVGDEQKFIDYASNNGAALAKFGGKFLVRAKDFTVAEGSARQRVVVIEFPSYEAALNCWNSPEYKAAKARQGGTATIDCIIVEGYAGAQPA